MRAGIGSFAISGFPFAISGAEASRTTGGAMQVASDKGRARLSDGVGSLAVQGSKELKLENGTEMLIKVTR